MLAPVAFIFCFLSLSAAMTSGQQLRLSGYEAPVPPVIGSFAQFLLPKTIQDVYLLSDYISGEEFRYVRQRFGDVRAVDAIYNKALTFSWRNHYAALMISLLSTMDHRRVDVSVPVAGIVIPLPLTPEFEGEFRRRVEALPAQLYEDTPAGRYGDRDKLQHFFGSALITYLFESSDVADRLGRFVEWGEAKYVVGETEDWRDIRSNREGQRFAQALLAGEEVWPSRFIGSDDERHNTLLRPEEVE